MTEFLVVSAQQGSGFSFRIFAENESEIRIIFGEDVTIWADFRDDRRLMSGFAFNGKEGGWDNVPLRTLDSFRKYQSKSE